MLDIEIYRNVRDHDFLLLPALDIRKYAWGSTKVYKGLVRSRMLNYSSKFDLLNWFKFWTEKWRLVSPFEGEKKYEEFKQLSKERHDYILKRIFSTYKKESQIHNGYDIWNAIDSYIITEKCSSIKNMLDFGAGYGRLGLIFGEHEEVKNYICIDSIEHSYMLQNIALSAMFPLKFYEYFEYAFERQNFPLDLKNKTGIYHLPAWKWDLIPQRSIDVIISVFVLPEINEFGLQEFIHQAKRCLKKGGYLYLRDHLYTTGEKSHKGAHKLNTEELLKENKFKIIYQGKFEDNKEIYGIPRVYQYMI